MRTWSFPPQAPHGTEPLHTTHSRNQATQMQVPKSIPIIRDNHFSGVGPVPPLMDSRRIVGGSDENGKTLRSPAGLRNVQDQYIEAKVQNDVHYVVGYDQQQRSSKTTESLVHSVHPETAQRNGRSPLTSMAQPKSVTSTLEDFDMSAIYDDSAWQPVRPSMDRYSQVPIIDLSTDSPIKPHRVNSDYRAAPSATNKSEADILPPRSLSPMDVDINIDFDIDDSSASESDPVPSPPSSQSLEISSVLLRVDDDTLDLDRMNSSQSMTSGQIVMGRNSDKALQNVGSRLPLNPEPQDESMARRSDQQLESASEISSYPAQLPVSVGWRQGNVHSRVTKINGLRAVMIGNTAINRAIISGSAIGSYRLCLLHLVVVPYVDDVCRMN